MITVIKTRFYRVRNINVEVLLVRNEQGRDIRYTIVEKFQGTKYKNEILRGVYNDLGVARIEFKRIANNLERVMPMVDFTLTY